MFENESLQRKMKVLKMRTSLKNYFCLQKEKNQSERPKLIHASDSILRNYIIRQIFQFMAIFNDQDYIGLLFDTSVVYVYIFRLEVNHN